MKNSLFSIIGAQLVMWRVLNRHLQPTFFPHNSRVSHSDCQESTIPILLHVPENLGIVFGWIGMSHATYRVIFGYVWIVLGSFFQLKNTESWRLIECDWRFNFSEMFERRVPFLSKRIETNRQIQKPLRFKHDCVQYSIIASIFLV